eukprot:CAMPEP_0194409130 /NCGR_PEP_ID=MMETSP0176-20130528/6945_1 /TAXON_ID=216777 /ORGANISM="Proboscia alata, Strain PI-D3" /LENGTH=102 /DNA_ID=CAMNT_0039209533 /DNA_START=400 /DNA_END=705 /DNA_ORIENTATION=+
MAVVEEELPDDFQANDFVETYRTNVRIRKLSAFSITHTDAISMTPTCKQQTTTSAQNQEECPTPTYTITKASLEIFLVRLTDLEAVTGLSFFLWFGEHARKG